MHKSLCIKLGHVLQAAAENDLLDDVVHRRANASLSFFAATQVFVTLITFVPSPVYPHPIINPPAAIGLEALALLQWWVAGRNYAKYSEGIGANPVKIIKVSPLGLTCLLETTSILAVYGTHCWLDCTHEVLFLERVSPCFAQSKHQQLCTVPT